MIEEPFRFVEAIANRREYIESQLVGGSPIVALNYKEGILLFTLGRERQKIFEVYDRIAMGAIGHPGDIERLRMTAIELASTEGFTRSAGDVSLRRMANYSLSPALKSAFEHVYGPPYLGKLLFAELGEDPSQNTFLCVDYDGAIQSNGTPRVKKRLEYAVLSGSKTSADLMEEYLEKHYKPNLDLNQALQLGFDAWAVGRIECTEEEMNSESSSASSADKANSGEDLKSATPSLPTNAQIREAQSKYLFEAAVEAAVLKYQTPSPVCYHALTEEEIQPLMTAVA